MQTKDGDVTFAIPRPKKSKEQAIAAAVTKRLLEALARSIFTSNSFGNIGHHLLLEIKTSLAQRRFAQQRGRERGEKKFEIGRLVEKKRIEIEMDVLDWVNLALDNPGIQLCPLTPRVAIQSARLPGEVHGDPVDRLLIATAFEENAVLVTCDKKILEFGAGKFISVFNPSK